MEDRALDLMIGEGPSARSVRIDLPKFTLVGATTRQGLITTPLRDRFGIPVRLNFYTVEELEKVVRRAAGLLALALTADGANEIARRSRGTPRIAGRLLRRVRDFAQSAGDAEVDAKVADSALTRMEVDSLGLDAMDRRYLHMIADIYKGGPVGVETLAAGLSEPRDTIEEVIEPYLIQLGLVARTARGRCLNGRAWAHLGLPMPKNAQNGLFDDAAAENSRVTRSRISPRPGRSSVRASLIASKADGTNTPFSTVLMVLRLTPTRSASSAWVRPSRARSSFNRLTSRSAILERPAFQDAEAQ